jgi:hypothetical protein
MPKSNRTEDTTPINFKMEQISSKKPQFTLKEDANGKYTMDSIENIKKVFSNADNKSNTFDQWKLWLDYPDAPVLKAPVKFTEVVAFMKDAEEVALVRTFRPFPQIKVKITKNGGTSPRRSKSALREL